VRRDGSRRTRILVMGSNPQTSPAAWGSARERGFEPSSRDPDGDRARYLFENRNWFIRHQALLSPSAWVQNSISAKYEGRGRELTGTKIAHFGFLPDTTLPETSDAELRKAAVRATFVAITILQQKLVDQADRLMLERPKETAAVAPVNLAFAQLLRACLSCYRWLEIPREKAIRSLGVGPILADTGYRINDLGQVFG
jgi:hypothetical protein